MNKRQLDITFEGGGARGIALNGAMTQLENEGFVPGRLVGTSAGAITAAMIAAGYTGAELEAFSRERNASGVSRMTEFIGVPKGFSDEQLLASSFGTFLQAIDVPLISERFEQKFDLWLLRACMRLPFFPSFFSFVEQGGAFSADGFVAWLAEKLEARSVGMSRLTFGEMFETTRKHFSVVVTDTTSGTFCVLNHITAPRCPVLWAVRMSMSIPFFWPEVSWLPEWGSYGALVDKSKLDHHAMVDGGVVSNFALRLLVSDEEWIHAIMGGAPDPETQVLGVYLDANRAVPGAPPQVDLATYLNATLAHSKVLGRVERVANAALSGNDLSEVFSHPQLVCFLPTQGYGVTEFNMSIERIDALLNAASGAMGGWLKQHSSQVLKIKDARALVANRKS